MRMRKRNHLEPRMEACSTVWIQDPVSHRGNWRALMPGAKELHLEIGCGKGKFARSSMRSLRRARRTASISTSPIPGLAAKMQSAA